MALPWTERWVLSYIFDYAIIIIFILGFSALDLVEPYHQHFSLDNQSIQYPYAVKDRISAAEAGIIACLFPLVMIIFWCMFVDGQFSHKQPRRSGNRLQKGPYTLGDRLWEMNCGILGLGLAVGGAIVITGALKNCVGKPRPDLIARCMPKEGSHNLVPYGLSNSSICTQPDHAILKDGFRSFPSGHSSTAFSGLGFFAMFIAGRLHVMDNRGEVWKTLLVMIPLLAASLVAASRIMDARHHPFDVITGSMLGLFTAWVAYRQYFPPLSKPKFKGRAFPRRTWGTDATSFPTGGSYAPTQRGDALEMAEEGRSGSTDTLDEYSARKRAMVGGAGEAHEDDIELRQQEGSPHRFDSVMSAPRLDLGDTAYTGAARMDSIDFRRQEPEDGKVV